MSYAKDETERSGVITQKPHEEVEYCVGQTDDRLTLAAKVLKQMFGQQPFSRSLVTPCVHNITTEKILDRGL